MKSKMKITTGIIITTFLIIGAYVAVAAQPQTICPVMGNPINKNIYTDYNGKRVYFCCPPCPSNFVKHPEAYLQRLAQIGQEPVPTP
ncbi:MAG: YHS domain-containing protein [Desulfobulbaceae bacterium]|nr:YHS domain-containing protein [Desulfobulbaceae bacterium]